MTRLVLVIALAACPSAGTPTHPQPGRDAGVVAESAPTEAECDALFDHAIALQAEPSDSADERTKLRADLRTAQLPQCRAMARASFACAMTATTLDAFTACDSRQP